MTELEKLRAWLLTYPQWDAGGLLYVDYTDAVPGNCGLFPAGLEVVSRKEDLLGNITVKNRCRFALYRVAARDEDGEKNAAWLLGFQRWVQAQGAARLAPTFGDEPASETIRAEQGKLHKASQPGTGMYVVIITAEFIKYY